MLSSWISRAQRVRSRSRASMPWRSRSISTERSAASRCATLAANARRASRSARAKRPSLPQRDHQAAALAAPSRGLDQHGARLDAEFVQPPRLRSARALELERQPGGTPRPARLHRHDAHPDRRLAAGRRDLQLAPLLDHDQQPGGVQQREAAIRGPLQGSAPSLRRGKPATALSCAVASAPR